MNRKRLISPYRTPPSLQYPLRSLFPILYTIFLHNARDRILRNTAFFYGIFYKFLIFSRFPNGCRRSSPIYWADSAADHKIFRSFFLRLPENLTISRSVRHPVFMNKALIFVPGSGSENERLADRMIQKGVKKKNDALHHSICSQPVPGIRLDELSSPAFTAALPSVQIQGHRS